MKQKLKQLLFLAAIFGLSACGDSKNENRDDYYYDNNGRNYSSNNYSSRYRGDSNSRRYGDRHYDYYDYYEYDYYGGLPHYDHYDWVDSGWYGCGEVYWGGSYCPCYQNGHQTYIVDPRTYGRNGWYFDVNVGFGAGAYF